MGSLSKVRRAGFKVTLLNDDAIEITPASNLTQDQREFLKTHKAEIAADLRAEQAVNDVYHKVVTCYTPSGTAINVLARDAEHAAFLERMNPKPTRSGQHQ